MQVHLQVNETGFYCKISEHCYGHILSDIFAVFILMLKPIPEIDDNNVSMLINYQKNKFNEIILLGEDIKDLWVFLKKMQLSPNYFRSNILVDRYSNEINTIKVTHMNSLLSNIQNYYQLHFEKENPYGRCVVRICDKKDTLSYRAFKEVNTLHTQHEGFFRSGDLKITEGLPNWLTEVFDLVDIKIFSDIPNPIRVIYLGIKDIYGLDPFSEGSIVEKSFICNLTWFGKSNLDRQLREGNVSQKCFIMSPSETDDLKAFMSFALQFKQLESYFDTSIKQQY